jgi:hypothetical protein
VSWSCFARRQASLDRGLAARGRSLPALEAGSYRGAFLGALRGREATLAGGAVRVLAGFLLNKSVDSDLLDAAGGGSSLIFSILQSWHQPLRHICHWTYMRWLCSQSHATEEQSARQEVQTVENVGAMKRRFACMGKISS